MKKYIITLVAAFVVGSTFAQILPPSVTGGAENTAAPAVMSGEVTPAPVEPVDVDLSSAWEEWEDVDLNSAWEQEGSKYPAYDFSEATKVRTGPLETLLLLAVASTLGVFIYKRNRRSEQGE